MIEFSFFVPGIPIPKGSTKAFALRQGPVCRLCHKNYSGRTVVTNDNDLTKAWQNSIAMVARRFMKESNIDIAPSHTAVTLELSFHFIRPQSHLRMGGKLAKGAPAEHTVKPDVDKLQRSVLDALTGIVYNDDSQVVDTHAVKLYSATTGMTIKISIHEYAQQMAITI